MWDWWHSGSSTLSRWGYPDKKKLTVETLMKSRRISRTPRDDQQEISTGEDRDRVKNLSDAMLVSSEVPHLSGVRSLLQASSLSSLVGTQQVPLQRRS